ncbi:hypothetical protein WK25_25045 [Burkholderia latens]|nr:hypothetical protein WK25_25045 [Burkholderia latens]
MSASIAPRAAPYKAHRASGAPQCCVARYPSRCIEAQMWCAAALPACDFAVRAHGTRCTAMRHCVRSGATAACMSTADAAAPARHAAGRALPGRPSWPGYC